MKAEKVSLFHTAKMTFRVIQDHGYWRHMIFEILSVIYQKLKNTPHSRVGLIYHAYAITRHDQYAYQMQSIGYLASSILKI